MRKRLQMPGMAVLQFGFSDKGAHIYLPQQLTPETVIYTGTHDNDTLVGWWTSGATEQEHKNVETYFGKAEDGVHWSFIRAAQGSVASLSVVPMQDFLGLGSEARMNMPSQRGGNWRWRLQPGVLTSDLARKMASLAEVTDRLPEPLAGTARRRIRRLKLSKSSDRRGRDRSSVVGLRSSALSEPLRNSRVAAA